MVEQLSHSAFALADPGLRLSRTRLFPKDNAVCESFFAPLECEPLDRRRFRSHAEAHIAVFTFIEGRYNPRRRHSALGFLSPVDHERKANLMG